MAEHKPTDSVWFWSCLFATFGLMFVLIIQSKFESRQSGIEKRFSARTTIQNQTKSAGKSEKISPRSLDSIKRPRLTLKPLIWILAVVVIIGWSGYWCVGKTRIVGNSQLTRADHER